MDRSDFKACNGSAYDDSRRLDEEELGKDALSRHHDFKKDGADDGACDIGDTQGCHGAGMRGEFLRADLVNDIGADDECDRPP